jgi:hypothetical protein
MGAKGTVRDKHMSPSPSNAGACIGSQDPNAPRVTLWKDYSFVLPLLCRSVSARMVDDEPIRILRQYALLLEQDIPHAGRSKEQFQHSLHQFPDNGRNNKTWQMNERAWMPLVLSELLDMYKGIACRQVMDNGN